MNDEQNKAELEYLIQGARTQYGIISSKLIRELMEVGYALGVRHGYISGRAEGYTEGHDDGHEDAMASIVEEIDERDDD
jgi:hypothetical protein